MKVYEDDTKSVWRRLDSAFFEIAWGYCQKWYYGVQLRFLNWRLQRKLKKLQRKLKKLK